MVVRPLCKVPRPLPKLPLLPNPHIWPIQPVRSVVRVPDYGPWRAEGYCRVAPLPRNHGPLLLLVLVWLRAGVQRASDQLGPLCVYHDQPHGHHAAARPDYALALCHVDGRPRRDRELSSAHAAHDHGCRLLRVARLFPRRIALSGKSARVRQCIWNCG